MANIGDLFIELVFGSDMKEADKFLAKTKEIIKETDKEIKKNQLLIKYLRELKEARTEAEKAAIKKDFKLQLQNLKNQDNLEAQENAKKKQREGFRNTAKAITGYITAISAAIYAVNRFTDALIQQNQQFLNLTRTSDVALSTFQKWDAIGKMYGINNAAAQIKNLNDRLFELKLTGANAKGFMLAGIRPTNAEDVLEQLRNRVAGLNDTSAAYLLRQMGLDENMLHILRMSRQEFNALNAEISRFQLTPEQRKDIQKMNVQIQIASQKLQYLKDRVLLKILPVWTKFLNFVARAAEGFALIASKLSPMAKSIIAVGAALIFLNKHLKILFTLLIRNPAILAITALITALMLLADDVRAYMTGGGSVIGVIAKALEDFQKNGFFNDKVPEWIRLLVRAADIFAKLFNLKRSDISYDEAIRGGFTEEEYSALMARGDAKRAERTYNNQYSNSNQNNETVIHQQNNITTTETGQEVLDSLLTITNSTLTARIY